MLRFCPVEHKMRHSLAESPDPLVEGAPPLGFSSDGDPLGPLDEYQ
jgi:hypothetical protein